MLKRFFVIRDIRAILVIIREPMNYQHKNLANGRWFKFSLIEQMANIGAEIGRAINWRKQGNEEYSQKAFFRGLELLSLSIDDPKNRNHRLKELCRLYETLGDYFVGDNEYKSSDELWEKYFYQYNYAAALERQKHSAVKTYE